MKLKGTRFDDELFADVSTRIVLGHGGDDKLIGASGRQYVSGGQGDDTLDGGSGVDRVLAGMGDDLAIYKMSDHSDGKTRLDDYRGGTGTDTLELHLSAEDWADASIQAEIKAFAAMLDANGAEDGASSYALNSVGLKVRNFEMLKLVVDGEIVDPLAGGTPGGPVVVDRSGSTSDEGVTITDAPANITTGSGDDSVTTGSGNDTVTTGDGDDSIQTGDGDDVISIGDGDDIVMAGPGNDTIIAGNGGGDDVIDGGPGIDLVDYPSALTIGSGISVDLQLLDRSATPTRGGVTVGDLLTAAGLPTNTPVALADGLDISTDVLIGVENVRTGRGDDTLIGDGAGNFFEGAGGNDVLDGVTGNDTLRGGDGDDTLKGGAGDDILSGGTADDTIDGDTGWDTLVLAGNRADYVFVNNDDGTHTVTDNGASREGTDLISGIENLVFADTEIGFWVVAGTTRIVGTDSSERLDGTPGFDNIDAFGGDDTIFGFEGSDWILPGPGDDVVDAAEGWDAVDYGQDEPRGATMGVSVDLGAQTATDSYGDTDTLVGINRVVATHFADTLVGSDSDEAFDPFGGDDMIDGLGGIDQLVYHWSPTGAVTSPIDIQFSAVTAGSGTVLDPFGDTDTFVNIESVQGTPLGDTILGGLGDQSFYGFGGPDTIDGGAGIDFVGYRDDASLGGPGALVVDLSIVDGAGFSSAVDGFGDTDKLRNVENLDGTGVGDQITGNAVNNSFNGRAGDDTIAGGAGSDYIEGGLGNDDLSGDADADWLLGDAGMDTLTGGPGDDQLWGGIDADLFRFAAGSGWDEIFDFAPGVDKLLLSGVTILGLSEAELGGATGPDTLVDLSSGDQIILYEVSGITDQMVLF